MFNFIYSIYKIIIDASLRIGCWVYSWFYSTNHNPPNNNDCLNNPSLETSISSTFERLPNEIYRYITNYLSLTDLANFHRTNKYLEAQLSDELAKRVIASKDIEVDVFEYAVLTKNHLTNKMHGWGQLPGMRESSSPFCLEDCIVSNIDKTHFSGRNFYMQHKNGDWFHGGQNGCGELGLGNEDYQLHAKKKFNPDVFKNAKIDEIHAGVGYSFAKLNNGKWFNWGNNIFYCLGNDNTDVHSTPTHFDPTEFGEAKILQIHLSTMHVFAKLDNGDWYCWGINYLGVLGINMPTLVEKPVKFNPEEFNGEEIEEIYGRGDFKFAKLGNGDWYCWGNNICGQLGVGDTLIKENPVRFNPEVFSGREIEELHLGMHTSYAKLDNGDWYYWGYQWEKHPGGNHPFHEFKKPSPVRLKFEVFRDIKIQKLYAGHHHTCVQLENGDFFCWGANHYGQLGRGYTSESAECARQTFLLGNVDKLKKIAENGKRSFALALKKNLKV